MSRLSLRVVAAAALLTTSLATTTPASAAPDASKRHHTASKSTVYLVQAVAKSRVTVTIDGRTVARKLGPGAASKPLSLSPGMHRATFKAPGWVVNTRFKVRAPNVDLVLHWRADKLVRPVAEVFVNDLRPVPVHHGRLVVAHTAVVPPADVRVDKKVVFANIANGEFVSSNVPAGTYVVDIVPTGQRTDPLFGPVKLSVRPELLTRIFAIGEPRNGGMKAVVQKIPLKVSGSPAPDLVDAGAAGLVAPGIQRAVTALGTSVRLSPESSQDGSDVPLGIGLLAVLSTLGAGAACAVRKVTVSGPHVPR